MTASRAATTQHQPPAIVEIDVPREVEAGAAFEVTVAVTDDKGVALVRIEVGGKPQTLKAKGETKETLTVTLTDGRRGTLAIAAVAFDGDAAQSTPVKASVEVVEPKK